MSVLTENIVNNYPGMVIRYNKKTGKIILLGGLLTEHILNNLDGVKLKSIDQFRVLINKTDYKSASKEIENKLKVDENWNIEYRIKCNTETLWLREQSQICNDKKGNEIDLFFHDVTEFKEKNKKLKKELTMVNKSIEKKNEYFASMSHEIRTPMNAVMGMAQILAKTPMDQDQKQYLGTIVNASNSLVQIINDILDVAKLEAGKIELLLEEVDIENLCLDVCQLLASRAEEKQIDLFLDFSAIEEKVIITDAGRIRQILINLIGNAIKFTETGHVCLSVESISNGKGNKVKFSIRDTGIGIPKEAQKTVFRAFSQADATIAHQFGGTGLGLQICKQLVTMLNGDLGVESEANQGSCFWFTLPVDIVKHEALLDTNYSNKYCLVVINNKFNAEIIEKHLKYLHFNVTVVNDSEDVLAMLTNIDQAFDYIILDKHLSGLDGLRLSNLVKKDKRYLDVPIILLTEIHEKENRIQLFEHGVNAYASKPLTPTILAAALKAARSPNKLNEAIYISIDQTDADEVQEDQYSVSGSILIADDLEVNRFILNSMLSQLGLVAEFAVNGQQAVEKVSNQDFDLIFMDCRMPVLDGFEASQQIKAMGGSKANIPIIALTANAGERDKQQCLDAGMDGFLSKPYTEKEIRSTVKNWISTDNIQITEPVNEAKDSLESEVLDITQFEIIRETLDDEFTVFATGMPDKFRNYEEELITSLKLGKMAEVHEAAHALKGLSGIIGAKRVSELAQQLESAGENKDLAAANVAISKLDTAICDTQAIILEKINPNFGDSVVLF